ncbi:MAG: hypothetical protein JWM97_3238 [Phycisphaerales bacterium]|nr:hypothetical protein [Phycisphaerales bacterium]
MSGRGTMIPASDDELRALLAIAARERFGPSLRISRVVRREWEYHSSFAMEAIDVTLDDGTELALVAKELGARGRLAGASAVKPAFLYDPLREVDVYWRFLDPSDVGAPACFGAAVDAAAGRCLLFLERVTGELLWQTGDLDVWCAAARWLAHFHLRFSTEAEALRSAPHLLRHDAASLQMWQRRASARVRAAPALDPVRQSAWLALEKGYPHVIEALLALPTTLLHGEFVPSNILIRAGGMAGAVCPVDWEMAAVGPGPMDLADLVSGRWTNEQRGRIVEAYREALPAAAGAQEPETFRKALGLCRLHRAVQWLGWSADWTPPAEHAHDWLGDALKLAEEFVL